jgi:hypothetical protein
MARYLIVAHQTAESAELRTALRDITEQDPEATFTLVIPATPVTHLIGWTGGESAAVARDAGERARARWEADGVMVEDVVVGDANPVYAVADLFNQDRWDQVIVSTLAAGVSRWLNLDVVSRIGREVDVPVTHVAAAG